MKYEILFRGKRVDSGEWKVGDLLRCKDYLSDIKQSFIFTDAVAYPANEFCEYEEVDPNTVGRYTGLIDKNNVKVFEGDIVRTLEIDEYGKQRSFPVVYGKGAFWLYDKYLQDNRGLDFLGGYDKEALEVIGNVFDNLELLEGGAEE